MSGNVCPKCGQAWEATAHRCPAETIAPSYTAQGVDPRLPGLCPTCGRDAESCQCCMGDPEPAPALDLEAIRERDKLFDASDPWTSVANPDDTFSKEIAQAADVSEADRHALLREVSRLTAETWALGTAANECMESMVVLMQTVEHAVPSLDLSKHQEVWQRANEYVNGWKRKNERRKEQRPWDIPARVGVVINASIGGSISWRPYTDSIGTIFRAETWRRLMGRRRADWSESHG